MWIGAKNGAQIALPLKGNKSPSNSRIRKGLLFFFWLFLFGLAFPCLDVGAGCVCVMKKVKQNGALALGALGIIL